MYDNFYNSLAKPETNKKTNSFWKKIYSQST